MARRGDSRRFGPGPYLLGLRRGGAAWGEGFPFDVPAFAAVRSCDSTDRSRPPERYLRAIDAGDEES